jgi:RNA polymerase subunit RPABC4/transcription elongation factor Spt4
MRKVDFMTEEKELGLNEGHCKHCEAIISLSAKTCPKCGGDAPITIAEAIAAGKRGKQDEEKLRAAGECRCRRCKKVVKITAETCPHCGIKTPGNTPMGAVIAIVGGIFFLGIVCLGSFVGVLIADGWMGAVMSITPLLVGIFGAVCLGISIFVVGWVIKTKKKAKAMQPKA